jgi:hypothetical protein
MLKAQKRHQAPCTRDEWDQRSCSGKGANCPIVIIGTLNGNRVRLSTSKFLPPERARDLEAARDLAVLWGKAGAAIRPEEYSPAPAEAPAEPAPPRPTVEMAVDTFMADAKDRGNSEATIYKKHVVFEKLLKRFCADKGIRFLSELDLNILREWRSTWKVDSLSRYKRQGQVFGFLRFCERSGWLPRNFAADMTKGLGKIQVKARQTGYFMPSEYKAILDASALGKNDPLALV